MRVHNWQFRIYFVWLQSFVRGFDGGKWGKCGEKEKKIRFRLFSFLFFRFHIFRIEKILRKKKLVEFLHFHNLHSRLTRLHLSLSLHYYSPRISKTAISIHFIVHFAIKILQELIQKFHSSDISGYFCRLSKSLRGFLLEVFK